MRKLILYLLILFSSVPFTSAQKNDLLAKHNDKGLYLEHKVVAKESYFSVGRKYSVHPKALATFNNLDINKGLQIDQKLKVPLTDSNFTQQGNSGTPVYYKTGANEGLVGASKANNNVAISKLRDWNNITGENVSPGTKLIIGFLQSKELPSVTIVPRPKTEEPVAKADEKSKKTNPVVEEKQEDVKEPKIEEKKVDPVVSKIDVKPILTEQGYFKKHFEQQAKTSPASKNETVTAGIFKTTSGWQDAKYYLLIDQLQPGTIVKIINPGNSKAVYAKVLGQMSGIRQNEGLTIRISNAAAFALEISEQDKFIVNVNY